MKGGEVRKLERSDGGRPLWLGGSRVLLHQYRTIGMSLVSFEEERSNPFARFEMCQKHFRESVVFIPLEVLESYLDDLLDLTVSDEMLFVEHSRIPLYGRLLLGASYAAIGALLYMLLQGRILVLISSLLALAAFFCFPGWYRSRRYAVRRLGLARIVSMEINRRRGRDDGPALTSAFHWRQIFSGSRESLPGAACRPLLQLVKYH